ncbi:hypothetical protein [Albirhodobacter sp. R86504]|uniref:hypothetical protein n=1 Tax=Albirhodobacter sp. R86504 TaxID=3093848 RepID=UPI00366F2DCF
MRGFKSRPQSVSKTDLETNSSQIGRMSRRASHGRARQLLGLAIVAGGLLIAAPETFARSTDIPTTQDAQTQRFPPLALPPRVAATTPPAPTTAAATKVAITPMTGEEFDARTQGRTIHFQSNGVDYGVEEYLPGNKVKWIFSEGKCKMGEWYQAGNQICFEYDGDEEIQCWIFADQPKGLMAWFKGNLADTPLISTSETTVPLDCEMIDFGV